MFRQGLAGAFQLLRDAPEVGSLYHDCSEIPGVRRLALLQMRYHIHYVCDAPADFVIVLAVWSMLRGNPPPRPCGRVGTW
jgi:hypothetical protein